MKRKTIWLSFVIICMLCFSTTSKGEDAIPFDTSDYAKLLAMYVDPQGLVNYTALIQQRQFLDHFVKQMATLSQTRYAKWNDQEKIAFWINAYNALTLVAIIDHYPIKASGLSALTFPKNSIRQIPGVWTRLEFMIMGEMQTLDAIEHQILRKEFKEPRIHMALVCAALSCPKLRSEPFTGHALSQQLDDQTQHFLGQPEAFRIDREKKIVKLSPIFKWFGKDFEQIDANQTGNMRFSKSEKAVFHFIASHSSEELAAWLRTEDYKIVYFDYDWSLNEQAVNQHEK